MPFNHTRPDPTSLPPSGSASGDLSGTFPSPTVSKLNGVTPQSPILDLLDETTYNAILAKLIDPSITELHTEALLTKINYISMNAGYTTVAGQTSGFVINYLPTSTTSAVGTTGFTAGVASTSHPFINLSSTSGFTAGDIILVSGTAKNTNDGFYEVDAIVSGPPRLRLKGIGITANVEDWTKTNVSSGQNSTGTVTKVNVTVVRVGTDGILEVGTGSSVPLTYNDVITVSTPTEKTYSSSPYTVLSTDSILLIDTSSGNFVITLPAVSTFRGKTLIIKKRTSDANTITINRAGSDTIDGATSQTISGSSLGSLTLVGPTTGSDWLIV